MKLAHRFAPWLVGFFNYRRRNRRMDAIRQRCGRQGDAAARSRRGHAGCASKTAWRR